jgi:hypothetical protein
MYIDFSFDSFTKEKRLFEKHIIVTIGKVSLKDGSVLYLENKHLKVQMDTSKLSKLNYISGCILFG